MSSEKWVVYTAKKWAAAYLYWRSEGINSQCSVIYGCGGMLGSMRANHT